MASVRVVPNRAGLALLRAMTPEKIDEVFMPDIVASAMAKAPVDTGALRDSIHSEVEGDSVYLVAATEYAAEVELGTSKMPAQPYLRPAIGGK